MSPNYHIDQLLDIFGTADEVQTLNLELDYEVQTLNLELDYEVQTLNLELDYADFCMSVFSISEVERVGPQGQSCVCVGD